MATARFLRTWIPLGAAAVGLVTVPPALPAATHEIRAAISQEDEEFERVANALQPGDRLLLHGGVYSQTGRRAVKARGTPGNPIVIEAAPGETPLLTHPGGRDDGQNNIEFVDCSYLVVRGLRFRGGSSGVRFIRGHHVTLEDCEIFETGNNALTMNSGDVQAFVIRRNHIHHTGLSDAGPTEGEGMYIGCHDGSCRTTDSVFEGNYIHHLRGTSDGGNDGIEIKVRSAGNVVRDNVIHDTNIGRSYPGIFVYGGGATNNTVEGNAIWNAGEGIQVIADAEIRNNVIFHCEATGITAAPHAALRQVRNVRILHNTIYDAPVGVRLRWAGAANVLIANNVIVCPGGAALAGPSGGATLRRNVVVGGRPGMASDGLVAMDEKDVARIFVSAPRMDFWPGTGGPLIGAAHLSATPELDFNGRQRTIPADIGAYQSGGLPQNPGWRVHPGFKR